MKLHLGCGRNILPGYVNIDSMAGPGVDVVFDLDRCPALGSQLLLKAGGAMPFDDNSVEEILGIHVLEHLHHPLELMQELWRVAKPGCEATFATPYGSSDDALEDPTHVRQYFLQSWGYFGQPYYFRADYGYRGDWINSLVQIDVPADRYSDVSNEVILEALMAQRNVAIQMIATLRAVKPARPHDASLRTAPKLHINVVG